MAAFKLIIFLTILSLFSCKTNNKQIIATWDNGKAKLERVYSDTPNCFSEKNYYENGQLASETKFVDSTKNGESTAYYKDGKLLGKCTYRNGKINGEVTEFHKTGNLMFKGNQIDGNLVGTATHYYDNGKPERELYYRDSKVFLVNYWDSSGVQKIIDGNGIGIFQDYFDKDKNGNDISLNVLVVGTYKDSLHNGLWKYYNLVDNKLVLERDFKADKIIAETWK
jgi:antitoxin component YwqK of YwqJK toxin-antitoxin module